MNNTCELNISSHKIKSCEDISKMLREMGIVGNVTPNNSIIKFDGKYKTEIGCKITYSCNPDTMFEKVWKPLQDKYDLGCAYININSQFHGCIYDLYRNSNCPGK
jgi:hypothetical protein